VHVLGSNPAAMRETLDELLELGWIRRNPGYGHPLRPEYILAPRGERLGPVCARLDAAFASLNVQDVALRKWSMPVLHVIGEGPTRFTQVSRVLHDLSDRALSLTLKDLTSAAIVARTLTDGPPPGSMYGSTNAGGILLPILDQV
jgi:DNA-binding HxlR family transcriptional regulator